MLSKSQTSSMSGRVFRPSASSSFWKGLRVSTSRLVITRSAPALARALANVWPRPRLAPVTTATLPARLNIEDLVFITRTRNVVTSASRLQHDLEQARLFPVKPLKPFRAFSQGRDRTDERRGFEHAMRQQVEARRIFAARGARSENGQFTRNRGLQRKLNRGRHISDERHAASLAHATQSEIYRGCNADRFTRDIRAAPTRQGLNCIQRIHTGGVNDVCSTAFRGQSKP